MVGAIQERSAKKRSEKDGKGDVIGGSGAGLRCRLVNMSANLVSTTASFLHFLTLSVPFLALSG